VYTAKEMREKSSGYLRHCATAYLDEHIVYELEKALDQNESYIFHYYEALNKPFLDAIIKELFDLGYTIIPNEGNKVTNTSPFLDISWGIDRD
jgi:hypothetical protein